MVFTRNYKASSPSAFFGDLGSKPLCIKINRMTMYIHLLMDLPCHTVFIIYSKYFLSPTIQG